jgi:NTE family protein
MGVVKALLEEGYAFDGVTGTSIGAINGAVIAQGAFEEGYGLWERAYPSLFFDWRTKPYQN